jgi:hypothetical protein
VFFKICGQFDEIETFAVGKEIRELPRLPKLYGPGSMAKKASLM